LLRFATAASPNESSQTPGRRSRFSHFGIQRLDLGFGDLFGRFLDIPSPSRAGFQYDPNHARRRVPKIERGRARRSMGLRAGFHDQIGFEPILFQSYRHLLIRFLRVNWWTLALYLRIRIGSIKVVPHRQTHEASHPPMTTTWVATSRPTPTDARIRGVLERGPGSHCRLIAWSGLTQGPV
jgi:hypothetical protein